jgi:hypothetical protein
MPLSTYFRGKVSKYRDHDDVKHFPSDLSRAQTRVKQIEVLGHAEGKAFFSGMGLIDIFKLL